MKRTLISSVALAALTATTAVAGGLDEPVYAPVPEAPVVVVAPELSWTGGYIGVQAGAGQAEQGSLEDDSTLFGVHAGYLHDLGSMVVGGEATIDRVEIDGAPDTLTRVGLDAKLGFDGGRVMPFVTAGVAMADADFLSESQNGFTLGAGASVMVGENFMLTGAVKRTTYDDFDGGGELNHDFVTVGGSFKF